MKDPLEDQLRQLRPGPLPARLRARIAAPPEKERIVLFPWGKLAAGLAVAACMMLLSWLHQTTPRTENVTLLLTESSGGDVFRSRKMGVVTDGGQRAWQITEVERVEGQIFAADVSGVTILTQNIRHELVPVEIHFD